MSIIHLDLVPSFCVFIFVFRTLHNVEVVDSDSFNDTFPSPAEMLTVEPDHTIQAVVMGYDHRLNYMKVAYASMLLKDRSTAFIVTNKDVILPGQMYDLPGRRVG